MREQIRLHAGNSFHTSVNSLLEQEGQGGSLSYSPTLTSVWQLVQLYVPLPGFSPVLQTCFISFTSSVFRYYVPYRARNAPYGV